MSALMLFGLLHAPTHIVRATPCVPVHGLPLVPWCVESSQISAHATILLSVWSTLTCSFRDERRGERRSPLLGATEAERALVAVCGGQSLAGQPVRRGNDHAYKIIGISSLTGSTQFICIHHALCRCECCHWNRCPTVMSALKIGPSALYVC